MVVVSAEQFLSNLLIKVGLTIQFVLVILGIILTVLLIKILRKIAVLSPTIRGLLVNLCVAYLLYVCVRAVIAGYYVLGLYGLISSDFYGVSK